MSESLYSLIALLADGNFHSGVELGKQLGISRSAVWKSLQRLPDLGLELQAVTGRGYRLAAPVELLNKKIINDHLLDRTRMLASRIELLSSIDSTNDYLKSFAASGAPSGTIIIAEHQLAGRGRRGRYWHSPYGSNLYLSVLWRFNDGMSRLGGLSLAVAVAMMRCFDEMGATGLGIKWPNDIVSERGKLAGILLDVAGESNGPCYAVIGLGVNYAMPQSGNRFIDQAWTQLRECGVTVGRNEVVACLLNNLISVLQTYERQGFLPFRKEWLHWDVLRDRGVVVHTANEKQHGIARGIDDSGLLLVERQGNIHTYSAGDVSLRRESH